MSYTYYDESKHGMFIPGCESWRLDGDIDAEISINSDGEGDAAEEEALQETVENEQEGSDIQESATQLALITERGFAGYDTIDRMRSYLASPGSNPRVVAHLFNLDSYVPNYTLYSQPGMEDLGASLKKAASNVGEFIKKIIEKIVTLFQRIIPWFGQNIETLRNRHEILVNKVASIDKKTGNENLKQYDGDRKVMSVGVLDGAANALSAAGSLLASIFTMSNKMKDRRGNKLTSRVLKRDTSPKKMSVDGIKDLLDRIGNTIKSLGEAQTASKKGLEEAKKEQAKLEGASTNPKEIAEARTRLVEANQVLADTTSDTKLAARAVTMALDDAKFLCKIAAG